MLIFSADNFAVKGLRLLNVGISYTVDNAAIKVMKSSNFIIEECILQNVPLIMGSDAHFSADVGNFTEASELLQTLKLTRLLNIFKVFFFNDYTYRNSFRFRLGTLKNEIVVE